MKIHSINHNNTFKFINATGKRRYLKHFKVVFKLSRDNLLHVGIRVSKRLSKKAVIRNKIKRRTRHAFRSATLKSGYYIIVPFASSYDVKFDELVSDLNSLVRY